MTNPSHLVAGLVIGKAVNSLAPATYLSIEQVYLVSATFSQIPDLNLLWRNSREHHKDFTHYPFFWVFLVLVIFLCEYFLSSSYILSLLLFLNLALHILMDSFGWRVGMYWFAPFNYKEFSFTKLDEFPQEPKRNLKREILSFFSHGVFKAEVTLNILSLIYLIS